MSQRDHSAISIRPKINQLLLDNLKELENVSDYAAEKKAEVQKLSNEFKDKGSLELLWDSKVPEKDKAFYSFFRLKASDRDDVLEEIQKYQDFYKEFSDAIYKVRDTIRQAESENTNPQEIYNTIAQIKLDLNKKLSEMVKVAELGENATSSSAIYDLHRSFIEQHEKIENMIRRVENVALKDGLKKATDGWEESIQSINTLRDESRKKDEKYNQMCYRFEKLMEQNEDLLEERKTWQEQNKKLETRIEMLLQGNQNK